MNFIYITKKHTKAVEDTEVSVTWSKQGGKYHHPDLRFSFSDAIKEKAYKNVSYLIGAYDKDEPSKIWFVKSDEHRGYKLSKSQKSNRFTFTPTGMAKVIKDPMRFVGNYDLYYDPYVKLWYIDCNKKDGTNDTSSLRDLADELKKGFKEN